MHTPLSPTSSHIHATTCTGQSLRPLELPHISAAKESVPYIRGEFRDPTW